MSLSVMIPFIILVVCSQSTGQQDWSSWFSSHQVRCSWHLLVWKRPMQTVKLQSAAASFLVLYDRLRSMTTIRLFTSHQRFRAKIAQRCIWSVQERARWTCLKSLSCLLRYLSSNFVDLYRDEAAVYFETLPSGELNFGHYGAGITLFAGFTISSLS